MTQDHEADPAAAQERDAIVATMERGIEAAQAGDLEAALTALSESRERAEEQGLPDLVAASLINTGFAYWVKGDIDAARRNFVEGADVAREADDHPRLISALVNFASASRQDRRWEEAAVALEEALPYLEGEPESSSGAHQDCALCLIEMEEYDGARFHLEEAERIAIEAGLDELHISATINLGAVRERSGDGVMAVVFYEDAAKMAEERGLTELQATATEAEAHAHARLGGYMEADTAFETVEDLYRRLGKDAELANALYWHGASLRNAGLRDRAISTWKEEEPIRRRLGQYTDLGDCLFEQAAVHRERDELTMLEGLYGQIEDAYRRGGNTRGLTETLVLHAQLLRSQDRLESALKVTDEALASFGDDQDWDAEGRLRVVRGTLFADSGNGAAAAEELQRAEQAAQNVGNHDTIAAVYAARAYLSAREGQPADVVAEQLRNAYEYGNGFGTQANARKVAFATMEDIEARCGGTYRPVIDAYRQELFAMRDDLGGERDPEPTAVHAALEELREEDVDPAAPESDPTPDAASDATDPPAE